MRFATAKTGFGKRLGRAFTLGVVPLVAVCLAVGYYRSANSALTALRTPWSERNRDALAQQIADGIDTSKNYFSGTIALLLILVFAVWFGRRRQEALGDEMEGLVRCVLHDVSRSLSTIDVEATNVMMGGSDAKLSAEKIDAISRGETKKIDTYMLLAKDFAGYNRASSERVQSGHAARNPSLGPPQHGQRRSGSCGIREAHCGQSSASSSASSCRQ